MTRKNDLTPIVATDIKIDGESIVSIKVAEFESNLLAQQAELEGALRDLKADQGKNIKAFEDEVKSVGLLVFDASKAIEALKALGFDVKSEITSVWKKERKEVDVELAIRNSRMCGYHLEAEKSVPATARMLELNEQLEKNNKEQIEKMAALAEVRKKLANVGTIERQARAAIAMHALNQTEEGRDLLESIKVEGLPSLPAPRL